MALMPAGYYRLEVSRWMSGRQICYAIGWAATHRDGGPHQPAADQCPDKMGKAY